jgi:glutamate--cysteine ligase
MRDEVAIKGLHAQFMGRTLLDIGREVLKIARAGLDSRGLEESTFLNVLDDEAARDKTKAQELLDLYNNVWGQDIAPVFKAAAY